MSSAKHFFTTGRNIIAIGRNYSEHAKELGNAVPTAPFYFLKPTSSYLANNGTIEIPQGCQVHHEIELAVVIGKSGRDIKKADAMAYVAGYALAIDLTARNVQNEAKKKGMPWTIAKGFDTFTPISDFISKETIPDPSDVNLWIKAKPTPEEIEKLAQSLNLPSSYLVSEYGPQFYPDRGGLMSLPPTDPVLYRLYEIVQVYGYPIKAVIHEKFGDGIMSAIDFTASVEKVEDPKGDRVKLVLDGKFLPYKKW
ncbi:hypothetical protein [Absidia glauca]|uniref:HTH cro/C1-type domain-containing protein n=1 Tax=Absidia glauca TaxID=4829 RepID=A0A163M0C7_ABSGL|nr:hypothetical protein [Absidia glauca]